MFTPEWIGLFIVVLSQIVVIAITIQSLRDRVRVLENKAEKADTSNDLLIEVKSKLDMLYDKYLEQHRKQ